ncbi:class I SAM-dependent methyltransferase [Allokutzneria oryzae]|uniref:Class I SAM-dependent methyltransferase n=1 Tax=Allokutzneria oryzae TaxID=1378989 RepID=A0ABV5ZVI6_9PSEU
MRVTDGFDKAAADYDRLVGANPGYHAQLRLSARRMGIPGRGKGLRLLDLGCGTGASTAALLHAAPEAEIVAVDGSSGMLARAREKSWPSTVSFVHSRAEDLADSGVRGPFDGIFAAYLVRNLSDPDAVLRAVRDLLRPGAPFVAHEYSVADSAVAKAVWTAVCWTVIIPAGRLASGDASLYRYLWRSVLDFDGVAAFEKRLWNNGFNTVRTGRMSGWQRGVAHTFFARGPQR